MSYCELDALQRHPELYAIRDAHPEAVALLWAHDYLRDRAQLLHQALADSPGKPLLAPRVEQVLSEGPLAAAIDKLLDIGAGALSARFAEQAEALIKQQAEAVQGPAWKQAELLEAVLGLSDWCEARTRPMFRDAPRFVADLPGRRMMIDGKPHAVLSAEALQWAGQLIEQPGQVVNPSGGKKPGKLLKMLPKAFGERCVLNGKGRGSGYRFLK